MTKKGMIRFLLWLLLVVAIPAYFGYMSGVFGLYFAKTPILYLCINLPLVFSSLNIYWTSKKYLNKKEHSCQQK